MVQNAHLQIGPLDQWTNPHQGSHSRFEVRNWTGEFVIDPLKQPHRSADLFLRADEVDVIAFLKDVVRWRICNDSGAAAGGDDGSAGIFANPEFGKRFSMRSAAYFDFERREVHFRLDRDLLYRTAAEHLVAPLPQIEHLPVDSCRTISETYEDAADDLERPAAVRAAAYISS